MLLFNELELLSVLPAEIALNFKDNPVRQNEVRQVRPLFHYGITVNFSFVLNSTVSTDLDCYPVFQLGAVFQKSSPFGVGSDDFSSLGEEDFSSSLPKSESSNVSPPETNPSSSVVNP